MNALKIRPGSSAQLVAATVLFWVASGEAPAVRAAQDGACTKTATAAFKACQNEADDEFWTATGNCYNLSMPQSRAECAKKATTARGDAKDECAEQREARLEICDAIGQTPYDPELDPAMFVDPAQIGETVPPNPYFPLKRGRTWFYKGGTETITVTVTSETKEILGISCVVVRDVVKDNGEVIEDTTDWYAQDINGNVWYMGEISLEIEDGVIVSIDGSWTAGIDGAKPGLAMKAAPAVGDVYRQEFSLGNAEDMAEVLTLNGSAVVSAASCSGNCLVTKEFLPLNPGVVEHKSYAPGVGMILEVNPDTGERLALVKIKS